MDRYFSVLRRAPFFDAVVAGVPVEQAAALVGACRKSGRNWWAQSAGMTLKTGRGGGLVDSPSTTRRVGRAVTAVERGQIQAGLATGMRQADIGRMIGRDPSVISREIARNSGPDGTYYGSVADTLAATRVRRPKPFKLIEDEQLCRRIELWMDEGWSPKLIALVLAEESDGDKTRTVSHETIYQALYVQARGNLRADLAQQLSLKRRQRVSRTETRRGSSTPFKEAFKISDRPAEVEDRALPGHWEGDRATRCRTG
jgi:IS30 family transposase